jgi:V8-like Glu-specific endopeptidase
MIQGNIGLLPGGGEGMDRRTLVRLIALLLIIMPLSAACKVTRGTGAHPGPGGWSRERFQRLMNRLAPQNPSPTAHPAILAIRVGALFYDNTQGDHYCTAGVVESPHGNLLVTAAHCIYSGSGGYSKHIVFVPGYQDGEMPYGVWAVKRMLVDDRWIRSSDPDLDVGFVTLESNGGMNIQQMLGANKLGINKGFDNLVRVTGYPSASDEPVTCTARSVQQSAFQMRFACAGYPGGTSGSPWVLHLNPHKRTGEIVGVIGGYQAGGDTDSVSYSSYFDDDIKRLYDRAASQG